VTRAADTTAETPPLVGVVVPVLNVEPWLDAMLQSLRAQTHPHWRAVVVDDGSTDATLAIARRVAAVEPRITVSESPERGPGARLARIHGRSLLPAADILYFADGDDLMLPRLLERTVDRLAARPDASAVIFKLRERLEDGSEELQRTRWWVPTRLWLRPLLAEHDDVPIPLLLNGVLEASVAMRALHYDACGGLEAAPALTSATFRDLLLRLALQAPVVALDEELYIYRRHARQASADRELMDRNRTLLDAHLHERGRSDPRVADALAERDFVLRHRLQSQRAFERAGALRRRGDWRGAARWARRGVATYRPIRPRR
jgi:glycosyltransferase involved in cell wall biosynthesis